MIILLPGNVSVFKRAVHQSPDKWGWLITPRRTMAKSRHLIAGSKWAADNECYALGVKFDPDRYIRFLERVSPLAQTCLFATAPDVVANAAATLAQFPQWRDTIHGLGLPVALVAQDGLENEAIPWSDFEALFIGGSTDWKLGPEVRELVTEAKSRDKWVHIGRVNSQKRLEYAVKIGADSVDGTEWAINPGRGVRWGTQVMSRLQSQMRLL